MTDPQSARALLRTMRRVRSVRSFRPDPVPDDVLTEVLEVARWTGSGSNRQPWTFLVVRQRATLGAIAAASPNVRHVAGAAAAIVIVMDGAMPEIETFDEGRVAERILVAATALGLASAIGWITPAGAPAVAALLGIPEGHRARTLVSLGYPTEEGARPKSAPGTARRPLAEMVRFERFS
ncbi:MAG TPA: nitroreductase family protein [Candidatus Dormibacteraeota bacterium]|nr:nitroreductase family protein [Candidatus Dormibacteraeota bacterium]